jgi:hypothetical protein
MSDLITLGGNAGEAFPSIYDLDLSDTENLFDDSAEYIPAALASQKSYDASWKAHRTVRFNSERLNWVWPSSRKEQEDKTARAPELSQIPDHHIVAVRGVPVKIRYGFKLQVGTGSDSKTICQTTKLEELLGENSRVTEDKYPLDVPLKRIYRRKADPNEPNPWLVNNPQYQLYGSRPPVGMPEAGSYSKPRRCIDCVAAGEHYEGTEEDFKSNKEIPMCRMDGYMMFCVMEVGILDYSELLEDPAAGRMKVKWKKLADANIYTTPKGGERQKIERPIILKIQGLGLSQHSPIGTGQYDWDVVMGSESNQSWLPENAKVLSMGEYYEYINDPRFYGTRHRKLRNQQVAYTQVTEVYIGKLRNKKYGMDFIPVFRPVTEPEIIEAGEDLTPQDWMVTGLQILQAEKAEANQEGGAPAPTATLPQAAKPKAVKPAAKNAVKVSKAEPEAEVAVASASSESSEVDEEFKAFILED